MDMSCREFSEVLAAKVSTPGGGAAAAYVGALGCALASMTSQFTLGKKAYAEQADTIAMILEEAALLQEKLLGLVQLDANNLEPLAKAYGLPKDDPQRPLELSAASAKATEAPLAMMECAARAIELIEMLLDKGSKLLLADTGSGAVLAGACLRAASFNVYVNVQTITDLALALRLRSRCDELLQVYEPRAKKVIEAVSARLLEV